MVKKIKLRDIINLKNGYAFKSKDYSSVGHFLIRITNVQKGFISTHNPRYFKIKSHKNFEKFILKEKDILISLTGDVGRVGVIQKKHLPCVLNQRVAKVEILNESIINNDFLFLFLNSDIFLKKVEKISHGTAQSNVATKDILDISFNLPSLNEQERIAAKLNTIFSKIDKAKINKETKLKEVQNLLGFIIDNELKKLSLLFPTTQLNEFVESVEYGTSKKCFKNGKYPVLRMGNIKDGQFIFDNLVYTNDKNEAEKYRVKKNDVFFNRTNSPLHVGKAAACNEEFEGLFAGYLIRINPKKEKLDLKFLSYYLNAPSIRQYGYSVMSSSVNQANINGSKLKQYPFINADIQTQSSLAKKIFSIETVINKLKNLTPKILNEYSNLKSAILKQELNNRLS